MLDTKGPLGLLVVLAVLYLMYRELRRQKIVSGLRDMAKVTADVASTALRTMSGQGYRGGQGYSGKSPYRQGYGQRKYNKQCDPACEQTPQGCMKHVIDPLTGTVQAVPCDPQCCKCKGCMSYADPFSGTLKCGQGGHDNNVQPCEPGCCHETIPGKGLDMDGGQGNVSSHLQAPMII